MEVAIHFTYAYYSLYWLHFWYLCLIFYVYRACTGWFTRISTNVVTTKSRQKQPWLNFVFVKLWKMTVAIHKTQPSPSWTRNLKMIKTWWLPRRESPIPIGAIFRWSMLNFRRGTCFFRTNPIPSMYGIFTYIWLSFMVNVRNYTCPMDAMGIFDWFFAAEKILRPVLPPRTGTARATLPSMSSSSACRDS